MKCPNLNCGLTNPPDAIRCDCGFNFKKGKLEPANSLSDRHELKNPFYKKPIFILLTIVFIFIVYVSFSQKDTKTQINDIAKINAIDIVKNTTSSKGNTLEIFFKKKVSIPAVKDLGWKVNKVKGGFIVEKKIHVDGLNSPTTYKWLVSDKDIIEPLNGHALGATQ
jgi:hypothetical protein|tara:strand:+ start:60 stop:557 length:498 start_codon:yes stop_codon:yes gene_type:complete